MTITVAREHALLSYSTSKTGNFYLGIQGGKKANSVGSYKITSTKSELDTIAGNKRTKSSINTNKAKASVSSSIDVAKDQDWFKAKLTSGYNYKFDVTGGNGSQLKDSYLTIYNSQGKKVAYDDNSGRGKHALLSYSTNKTANFYIGIQGGKNANNTGSYKITSTRTNKNSAPVFSKSNYWGTLTESSTSSSLSKSGTSGKLKATDKDRRDRLIFSANKLKGTYGTLTLNKNTGAYDYSAYESKIDALGNKTVYDNFKVSVTDGKAEDTANLKFKIVGKNDALLFLKLLFMSPTQMGITLNQIFRDNH